LIRSTRPANEICDAINKSQAFTVEAEVESLDLTQSGPARIVSISKDPVVRNFTIAEQMGNVVVRVRTPRNGVGGGRMQFRTESRVLAGGMHHISTTVGRGTVRLFVDGAEPSPPLRFSAFVFITGNWAVSTGVCAGIVFFFTGVVSALLFARKGLPVTVLLGYLTSVSLPLTFALAATFQHGHEPDATYLAGALVGPLLGLLVAWSLRRICGNSTWSRPSRKERRPSRSLKEEIRG
jgi:hypothetical protein